MAEFVHIQPTGRFPMVINLDHVVRIEEHQDHSIIVMSDKTVWTVQMSASAVPQLQRLPGSRGLFACSFTCPGQAGVGHLIKLRLYLGTVSIDGSQTAPALFYEYSTKEFPQASGFSIGSASNLSCHVNGMTLDYSGPSK